MRGGARVRGHGSYRGQGRAPGDWLGGACEAGQQVWKELSAPERRGVSGEGEGVGRRAPEVPEGVVVGRL